MHDYHTIKGGLLDEINKTIVAKLLDQFLGIGICKNCGYKHPGILGYCEHCIELAHDTGIRLYQISSGEYYIRRGSKLLTRSNYGLFSRR